MIPIRPYKNLETDLQEQIKDETSNLIGNLASSAPLTEPFDRGQRQQASIAPKTTKVMRAFCTRNVVQIQKRTSKGEEIRSV